LYDLQLAHATFKFNPIAVEQFSILVCLIN